MNFKVSVSIMIVLCVLLIITTAIITAVYFGRNETSTNTGIESGFRYSNYEPLPSDFCAYKSDTNEFDINNVSLTFYYGGIFSPNIEHEQKNGRNIPEFDVHLYNVENKTICITTHIDENFISEKYRCSFMTEKEKTDFVEISFSYSEKITIPNELFSENQGEICFSITGLNINEINPEEKILTCIYIGYKVVGEKVVLSSLIENKS